MTEASCPICYALYGMHDPMCPRHVPVEELPQAGRLDPLPPGWHPVWEVPLAGRSVTWRLDENRSRVAWKYS